MTIYKPCCIDIYHGNNVSDSPSALAGLDRAKASGIFALIHKVTEGTKTVDARYDARRQKWMSGGAIRVTDVDGSEIFVPPIFGGYHFFHGQDPAGEATFFLRMARLGPGDLPFIDWEAVGASGYYPSIAAADEFCQTVEQALGRPCGVYGGNVPRELFDAGGAAQDVLERFSKRPLWFCAYGGESNLTRLPEPWKETGVFLWQDDGDQTGPGPHTIPGIDGYTDNSTVVSPATFATLHAEWLTLGGVEPPAAPATPPVKTTPLPPNELFPPSDDNSEFGDIA